MFWRDSKQTMLLGRIERPACNSPHHQRNESTGKEMSRERQRQKDHGKHNQAGQDGTKRSPAISPIPSQTVPSHACQTIDEQKTTDIVQMGIFAQERRDIGIYSKSGH